MITRIILINMRHQHRVAQFVKDRQSHQVSVEKSFFLVQKQVFVLEFYALMNKRKFSK